MFCFILFHSLNGQDENLDLFFEVECHTLIGVANVFLECLLHDVSHEYAAPIISQQGEVRHVTTVLNAFSACSDQSYVFHCFTKP